MSNASLKEQLQAMASKLSSPKQKSTKPKWLDHAQYGVELLKAYFPHCFKSTGEIAPLKIGIKQDLVKFLSTSDRIVTDDKACMVKSLSYYVNTAAYHKTVIEGATRIDLDGKPVGVVTAEEATYSTERQQAKLQAKQARATSKPQQRKEVVT